MKKILFVLLMILPMAANAQRADKPGEPYDVYCGISISSYLVYISLDYGKMHELLYDDNNKPLKMIEVEAITYMSKIGWEYIETVYPKSALYSPFFLFKKKVKSDEEILEGLRFEEKKKKKKKK